MMSKRYLRRLVEEGYVAGWDDPRMPTLCGLRRRGYTAESIRDFLTRVGVAKADSVVETAMLEHCVREDLNAHAHRMMAVLDPIRLVIENWPEGKTEAVTMENLPGEEAAGSRTLHFGRELYIQREDFSYDPPKKYFRLKPDGEGRLTGADHVTWTRYETDEAVNVTTVYCTYDPESHSGEGQRKVKGTLHWLSKEDAVPAEIRLYQDLLLPETPENAQLDFTARLNPDSIVKKQGFVEPALAACQPGSRYQFMRVGYFCADLDHSPEKPVFNRIVGLKDSFKMN